MRKIFYSMSFLGLIVVLMSCDNLFNPTGESSTTNLSADGLIEQGDMYLRQGRNYDAYQVYKQAVLKDSSKSLGYYGMAKASLRENNVNPLTLLGVISDAQKSANPVSVIGQYMIQKLRDSSGFSKGIEMMTASLDPFYRRDSINSLYLAWKKKDTSSLSQLDSAEKVQDSIFEANFLPGKSTTSASYSFNQFPIMDSKVVSSMLVAERNVSRAVALMSSVNSLFSGVTSVDSITNDLTSLVNGSKSLSDLSVFKQAMTDSNARNNLNNNISSLATNASNLATVAASISQITGQSSASSDSIAKDTTLQTQIKNIGPAIIFYKVADGKDNDGDGCIDEEIYDGIDNDGDGLIDEDIRGTVANVVDHVDNDHNGVIDEAAEGFDENGILIFTKDPNFVKGPHYTDKALKLAIAQDTNFTVYSLAQRQALIGGCWRNYK